MIELMAATAISALFMAAFFAAFFVMRNELYQQNVFFSSNRWARFAIDMVTRDTKEAITIRAQSAGGDTTGNQVLVLRVPSIDANGEPTDIDNNFDEVVYKLDSASPTTLIRNLTLGGSSQRNDGTNSTGKIIARNVTGLTFSNTAGTGFSSIANETSLYNFNIQITVRGTTLRSSQTQTTSLNSNVRLRNKPNG